MADGLFVVRSTDKAGMMLWPYGKLISKIVFNLLCGHKATAELKLYFLLLIICLKLPKTIILTCYPALLCFVSFPSNSCLLIFSDHYCRPLSIVPSFIVTPYETFPIIPPPSLPICLVQHKDFPLSIVPSVYNPHFPKFLYCQKGGTIDRGPL